jgi:hypothetical protein
MTQISVSVDRFEGTQAVLVDSTGKRKWNVQRLQLPAGTREGDWLLVEMDEETIGNLKPDPEAKQAAQKRIDEKLELLRNRSKK